MGSIMGIFTGARRDPNEDQFVFVPFVPLW
jgi:hypothetical protein